MAAPNEDDVIVIVIVIVSVVIIVIIDVDDIYGSIHPEVEGNDKKDLLWAQRWRG